MTSGRPIIQRYPVMDRRDAVESVEFQSIPHEVADGQNLGNGGSNDLPYQYSSERVVAQSLASRAARPAWYEVGWRRCAGQPVAAEKKEVVRGEDHRRAGLGGSAQRTERKVVVNVVRVDHVGLEFLKLPADFREYAGIEHAEVVPESFRISRIDTSYLYAVHVLAAGLAGILHSGHNQDFVSLRRKMPGESFRHDPGSASILGRVEVGQIRDSQFRIPPSTDRGIFARFLFQVNRLSTSPRAFRPMVTASSGSLRKRVITDRRASEDAGSTTKPVLP